MNQDCRDQSGAAPKASSNLNEWVLARSQWLIPIQLERLAECCRHSGSIRQFSYCNWKAIINLS